MSDEIPSSREFLKNSIQSHADLAIELLKLTIGDSGDGYNRFDIASVIIFLTGVEKMLNIAFGLLYLARVVKWKDIVSKRYTKTEAGFIHCRWGLTKKINELEKLGADITPLIDIIELRNYFIHDSSIYAGYAQVFDEATNTPKISAVGPRISYPLSPSSFWTNETIKYYTELTLDAVSSFVDTTDWKRAWCEVSERLEKLPTYDIDLDLVHDPERQENIFARIEELNNKHIGLGLRKLLPL
jgi:hypothetical protein